MSVTMKSVLCAILALILISAHCATAQTVTQETTSSTGTSASSSGTGSTSTGTGASPTATATGSPVTTTKGGSGGAGVKPEVALLTLFGGLVALLV